MIRPRSLRPFVAQIVGLTVSGTNDSLARGCAARYRDAHFVRISHRSSSLRRQKRPDGDLNSLTSLRLFAAQIFRASFQERSPV